MDYLLSYIGAISSSKRDRIGLLSLISKNNQQIKYLTTMETTTKYMKFIVYDSLGNPMRRFNSRRAAIDYKTVFGNSKWYIYEVHR